MPDDDAFHAAINKAQLVDQLPRLVYADWLDENDRHDLADGYRVTARHNRVPWATAVYLWSDFSVYDEADYDEADPERRDEQTVTWVRARFGGDEDLSVLPSCWVRAFGDWDMEAEGLGLLVARTCPADAFRQAAEAYARLTPAERAEVEEFFARDDKLTTGSVVKCEVRPPAGR